MNKVTTTLVGVLAMIALAACGGSDAEADARAELKDLGFTDSLVTCVMDELKDRVGDLEAYIELEGSEQQTMAAEAGAECAQSASPEELGDVIDEIDVDISDPTVRPGLITGMTSQGISEEMANCILDEAGDQGLAVSDLVDQAIITELVGLCQ